jgi:hypothetical protein
MKVPIYDLPAVTLSPTDSPWPVDRAGMFKCIVDPKGAAARNTFVNLANLFAWLEANGIPLMLAERNLAGATTAEPTPEQDRKDCLALAVHLFSSRVSQ